MSSKPPPPPKKKKKILHIPKSLRQQIPLEGGAKWLRKNISQWEYKVVNKQLKTNAVNLIQALFSFIQGTSYGKRAAHCKIREWQVVNEKMNSNSMLNMYKTTLQF